ncbi:MAG: cupin domain-containing protein [Roseiarcus sp.]
MALTPVLNLADVELLPRPPAYAPKGAAAERYDARMGFIGPRVGAQKLGYNVTSVPPGKRAFPLHNHRVKEEMFFVLAGTGEVRIGAEAYPIRPGDVIACPPGGPETAHAIVDTGGEELSYLAVSTMESPEIVEYPETGRFGVLAELPASGGAESRRFRFIGREGDSLDYWEGY